MLIQLYVLRQLALSVLFSVGGLAVIVLPTVAIQAVNRLGALDVGTVAGFLPLVVAELVPYLLPLSFLLAVVATYGRLAAEREFLAMQMAGIHPLRLALPGLLVSVLFAVGTDQLLGEVSPMLKFEKNNQLADADKARFLTALKGRNVLTFGHNVLRGESTAEGTWLNAELDLERDGQSIKLIASEVRADVVGSRLVLRLKDAKFLSEVRSGYNLSPTISLELSEIFPSQERDRSKAKYLTNTEIRAALSGGDLTSEERPTYVYEIHRRHALAATYVLFLLLGIPTGLVLRSSTQLGAFTGAVGYAFFYYVLNMRLGKVLGEAGAVPSVLAAWATNALFLVVGLVFFVRALFR